MNRMDNFPRVVFFTMVFAPKHIAEVCYLREDNSICSVVPEPVQTDGLVTQAPRRGPTFARRCRSLTTIRSCIRVTPIEPHMASCPASLAQRCSNLRPSSKRAA